jgi:hypothetical protein
MLGTTLGSIENGKLSATSTTAFGDGDKNAFFTGKPHVEGLGNVFLFRNYRSDLGKWQTSAPLGYPDGLNNFAYVNNCVTMAFDWLGAKIVFHGEAAKYEKAVKDYIRKSAKGKEVWDKLANAADFTVDIGDYNQEGPPGPFWDPNNNQLAWKPHEYDEFERNGKDLHLSPALLLAHELAHAYRSMTGEYDTDAEKEEKAVLNEYENPIAKDLGEPERTWEEYNDSHFYDDKDVFPTPVPE